MICENLICDRDCPHRKIHEFHPDNCKIYCENYSIKYVCIPVDFLNEEDFKIE